MCDVVYVLLIDRLERHVLVERQVAVAAASAGVASVTIPTLEEELERFEAWLTEPPKLIDPERLELMRALGVAA